MKYVYICSIACNLCSLFFHFPLSTESVFLPDLSLCVPSFTFNYFTLNS